MTNERYSLAPEPSSHAQPHPPTEVTSNNRRSLTPIPLLQDADYLRNSRRFPPMASRPPPPPPPSSPLSADPGAPLPYPGYFTSPHPTTPSGSIHPSPQELPLPARSSISPTLKEDAVEAYDDIIDVAKDYGQEIVERAEFDAKWIEEQIQKIRDETDAKIKELEDEFRRKIREPQETLRRLRALIAAQKMSLGLMKMWEEQDEECQGIYVL
ncbi:hypothetical protein NW768_007744 [Fusarium equiseti]|uniref:Transcription factor n=1 Tax=Fusarium equiseti TaxID=61235 RepID=A0ABQ8R8F2_FUSEQ|nr:hypothetical protein NW768_007744 [Fusarium equiseti]